MNYVFFTFYAVLLPVFGWATFSLVSALILFRANFGRPNSVGYPAREEPVTAGADEGESSPGTWTEISARDKISLAGRWFEPVDADVRRSEGSAPCGGNGDSRGVAILLHGLNADSSSMEAVADSYLEAGWSVLAPDLRGHGRSAGPWRTMGALEASDLSEWVRHVGEVRPGAAIALHGAGIGACAALRFVAGYANGNTEKPKDTGAVIALVLDAPALTEGSSYRNKVKRILAWFPFYAGTLLFSDMVSLARCGVTVGSMDARPAPWLPDPISRIPVPLLLFEGKEPPANGPVAERQGDSDAAGKKERLKEFLRRIS